jgi:hypothetical protein
MSWIIYYKIEQQQVTILRCVGQEPALSLPDHIAGLPVTALGSSCFLGGTASETEELCLVEGTPPPPVRWNDTLKRIRLPRGLRRLGERCFAGLRALPRLELPEGLETMGAHCFHGCGKLTHLELPDQVTALPEHTFSECRALEQVRLPAHVQTLGRCCFYNCTHLKALTLPDSVTAIGDRMLMNCFALSRLSLPMGLNAGALLDDLSGVVRITARDGVNSVTMVLPEYSYEYDELIPARQFRAVAHGSGGLYRGCFSDRDIDFELYDSYFYECKRDEPPELAAEVALSRLRWPRGLRPGPAEDYWQFLLANPAAVGATLLKMEDLDGLSFLLSSGRLGQEQIDVLLESAESAGQVRFVSRLLEASGQSGGADKEFAL